MSNYEFPQHEVGFVVNQLTNLRSLYGGDAFPEMSEELLEAILSETARWVETEIAPHNYACNEFGAKLESNGVVTAPGLQSVYQQYVEAGWQSLSANPEHGGQGLPQTVYFAVMEALQSSNLGFSLCPMLTAGALEAIESHADAALQAQLMPNMISGAWTGSMNLTEPHAGSDLAAVSTKAEPEGDHYRIKGQKIYITWGDHDVAENIIHLVLARLPDAPAGVKGISLFAVPKFLINADGSLGERNDVHCIALEEKLGIHSSPTCVMAFGETTGAIGYLVGKEHNGLACMFTMMNNARLGVGMQGVAIAERALQQAKQYAAERVQGYDKQNGERITINHHADVQRMLLSMQSLTEAARAMTYEAFATIDKVKAGQSSQSKADLLTPIVKGFATEMSQEVTSLNIQIHGGMGFVEETGAAQHYRDARILTIYEGTTGIQALDLIGRKTARDNGHAMFTLLDEMRTTVAAANESDEFSHHATSLTKAIDAVHQATESLLAQPEQHQREAVANDYMMLCGYVLGAERLLKSALLAANDSALATRKKISCAFYFDHILPRYLSLHQVITAANGSSYLNLAAVAM